MSKYFSMERQGNTATLNIYGDIGFSFADESVRAKSLVQELEAMGDVQTIDVYINSYGGEVAEGLAIYNALRRHKAKVITHCEGMACSIASVIFMAGDERIMNEASLLMIHNAWTIAEGDSKALRKQADDLEKITQASVEAYKSRSTLDEKQIRKMMDAETWLMPDEAIEYGFATAIEHTPESRASQHARASVYEIVKAYMKAKAADTAEDEETEEEKPEADEQEGEEAEEKPETAENSDEKDEAEEEAEDEENGEKTQKKAAEKLSGIFNAILKI